MAVNPAAAVSAATPSVAARSQTQLSSNFETFLTLLTAQLANQDPLSPMDSNQFTQQLVQFSQVEQQINSNKNLEQLISLTKNQSSVSAVSYLGKTLTLTDGSGALMNGNATWAYSLDNAAASANLIVSNAQGKTVYAGPAETGEGTHAFAWNGMDNSGQTLSPGVYTLKIAAKTSDGKTIATRVASQGVVSEIDLTGTEPLLMIGPIGVPLSKAALVSGN